MKRTAIRPVSKKRRAERPARLAVVEACMERDGWVCRARQAVPEIACEGLLDAHEVVQRSLRPGVHLELDLMITVCRRHHMWIDDNVARAHELGLLVHSWEVA